MDVVDATEVVNPERTEVRALLEPWKALSSPSESAWLLSPLRLPFTTLYTGELLTMGAGFRELWFKDASAPIGVHTSAIPLVLNLTKRDQPFFFCFFFFFFFFFFPRLTNFFFQPTDNMARQPALVSSLMLISMI